LPAPLQKSTRYAPATSTPPPPRSSPASHVYGERRGAARQAGESRRPGAGAIETLVEVTRPCADRPGEFPHEPRRLLGDRLSDLAARDDLTDRAPHLFAVDDAVDELVRSRARKRVLDGPVERAGGGELRRHPLQHPVLDHGVHELLRQRLRECAVDQARELGN
jgi:hypothetical protein